MRIKLSIMTAVAALLAAACGSSVTGGDSSSTEGSGGNDGTGGGGGIGGYPSSSIATGGNCPGGDLPCCDPTDPHANCCLFCGAAGVTTGGGTGGGSATVCGGKIGKPCQSDEYCDFTSNLCGAEDGTGTCKKRPQACDDVYSPVCACDGSVHPSECDANAAGLDVSQLGTCKPPQGFFACGPKLCQSGSDYCQHTTSDVGGQPDDFACRPLPPACEAPASCSCLANQPCGQSCKATSDGGFEVLCPGG